MPAILCFRGGGGEGVEFFFVNGALLHATALKPFNNCNDHHTYTEGRCYRRVFGPKTIPDYPDVSFPILGFYSFGGFASNKKVSPADIRKVCVCPPALIKLQTYDVVFSNDA